MFLLCKRWKSLQIQTPNLEQIRVYLYVLYKYICTSLGVPIGPSLYQMERLFYNIVQFVHFSISCTAPAIQPQTGRTKLQVLATSFMSVEASKQSSFHKHRSFSSVSMLPHAISLPPFVVLGPHVIRGIFCNYERSLLWHTGDSPSCQLFRLSIPNYPPPRIVDKSFLCCICAPLLPNTVSSFCLPLLQRNECARNFLCRISTLQSVSYIFWGGVTVLETFEGQKMDLLGQ